MAFTGRLGTPDSQPGNIVLGSEGELEGSASAQVATGTGAALNASALVAPNAGLGSGTGSALDATVSTETGTSVDAELASGSGSALDATPWVAPNAGLAAGSGAALDAAGVPSTAANAEIATGAGAAQGPSAAIVSYPATATGAGSAGNATAEGGETNPAFQSGAFQSDAFQIAPFSPSAHAGVATGTGGASTPLAAIHTNASAGSGVGAAYDAIVSTDHIGLAGHASGTGTAHDATVTIAVRTGLAAGTGAAYDASISFVDDYASLPEGDIATGYMPPLAAPIDDDDTTIIVTTPSSSTPDEPFVVLIDDEQVLVTDVSGTTWTVVRGYNDTVATSHGSGAYARPALARVTVNGVDTTAHVHYGRSRFTTAANGQAGTAEIWVRDLERTRSFTTGKEVVVSFRGIRMWGGYVATVRRQFVFDSGTGIVGDEPRWLILDCVDYNVLFNKRIFFDPADTDDMAVKHWPNGTRDELVISELVNNYLTLGDDGLSFDIRHVGTPALPQINCNPLAPDEFGIGSAGWTWGEVMASIISQTGAVYYIDPDKVFRYVDDSTKQSRFGWSGLSDAPNDTTTIGYRDAEFALDGARLLNDQLQWGAGQGSDSMVFSRVTDSASVTTHGLWQGGELRFDMYCQDSVDLRAQTWVYGSPQNRRGGKDDRFFSRVTVREPYFRVADVVSLASTEFGFTQIAPVRHSEITFPTPWDIKCILTIAHELDAPWQTFEFWFPQFSFDPPQIDWKDPPGIPWPEPWGPFDPCELVEGECVVVDTFTRSGASLGTSDSGHTWGVPIGITNTYTPTTDGSEAIFQVEAGFSTSTDTTHTGSGRLNLSAEAGLFVPLTASFRFKYSGTWDCTWVENPVLSGTGFWAPGFSSSDDPTDANSIGSGGGYRRNFLNIRISNSIPVYRFHIYNADGALYAAAERPTATDGSTDGAVLIGAQLAADTWCNVKVHLDSDRLYLRLWPDGSTEPSFYQVQTSATGSTWADQEFEIISRSHLEESSTPAFTIRVDDLCISRSTYAGDLLGWAWFPPRGCEFDYDYNASLSTDTPVGLIEDGESTGVFSYIEPFSVSSGTPGSSGGGDATNLTIPNHLESGDDSIISMSLSPNLVPLYVDLGGGAHWEITLQFLLPDPDGRQIFLVNYEEGGTYHIDFTGATTGDAEADFAEDTPIDFELHWDPTQADPERLTFTVNGLNRKFTNGGAFFTGVRFLAQLTTTRSATPFVTPTITFSGTIGCGDRGEAPMIDPCLDADEGEFAESGEGSVTGSEPEATFVVGPEGGTLFLVDDQYQRGSTEVWVDGLRIRLGEDYLEYPRSRKIEILDHIDVDGAVIRVNYVIWTVEQPSPELEPE